MATMVKFPSGVGRVGVPGGGKVNLSAAGVSTGEVAGAFPLVRVQWWNSKDRPTQGAWLLLPACDMVEFGVTLIEHAVAADPKLRNDVFAVLARLAMVSNPLT